MGTYDYMSPEQTTRGDVDIRSDIYSLGSTLYRLLRGRAPFGGDSYSSPVEKMIALVQKAPTPLQELRGDVPEGLCGLLDCMLAKDPMERPSQPIEIAHALAPYCQGADLDGLGAGLRTSQRKTTMGKVVAATNERSRPGQGLAWMFDRKILGRYWNRAQPVLRVKLRVTRGFG